MFTPQPVEDDDSGSKKAPASTSTVLEGDGGGGAREVLNGDRDGNEDSESVLRDGLEGKLVRKIDLRLCTIAGILCSLNLLDSGIISSASVTSIFADLGLGVGNRYVSFAFLFFSFLFSSLFTWQEKGGG